MLACCTSWFTAFDPFYLPPALLCPWRQLPLPYCLLLVIVARPLGACLLLKTPPLLPTPGRSRRLSCCLLLALASTTLFRACLLLVITARLRAIRLLRLPGSVQAPVSCCAAPRRALPGCPQGASIPCACSRWLPVCILLPTGNHTCYPPATRQERS